MADKKSLDNTRTLALTLPVPHYCVFVFLKEYTRLPFEESGIAFLAAFIGIFIYATPLILVVAFISGRLLRSHPNRDYIQARCMLATSILYCIAITTQLF